MLVSLKKAVQNSILITLFFFYLIKATKGAFVPSCILDLEGVCGGQWLI